VPNLKARSSRVRVALLLAGLSCFAACETSRNSTQRARNEAVNLELFQQLLEGGTMQPLDNFEEDAYLAQIEERYRNSMGGGDQAGDETPLENTVLEPEPYDEPVINPYVEFGGQIQPYSTGLIMKPYTFPAGMGTKVLELLTAYGDFPIFHSGIGGAGSPGPEELQPLDSVMLDLRPGWSVEAWSDPRGASKGILQAPNPIVLGDMLIVTASPDLLADVEHFIRIFIENVKQIEIEAQIVEVITTDSLDVGIRRLDESTPIFGLPNPGSLVNQIDFSLPNTVETGSVGNALFGLGAVFDGVTFNAVLEAVAASENVSIISHPKVAVREGARADIVNTKEIPFFNISAINANGNFTTTVTYKPVGVQMYVIPRVIGDDTIILTIDIEASQQTGTAVTFTQGGGDSASQITVPEISHRAARTIVRLESGQAVIIGGLITKRTLEREKKIPFLGDIPLLGGLFRSRFSLTETSNVLFLIRPRILVSSDMHNTFSR
jgi:type II secretory pathway component GspD/PulD (secretin)